MKGRELIEACRQFARGSPAQRANLVRSAYNRLLPALGDSPLLALDPTPLLLRKVLRLPPRAPSRHRDPDAAIGSNPNHVAARARMANKLHKSRKGTSRPLFYLLEMVPRHDI